MQVLSEAAETLLQYLELVATDSAAADSPLTLAVIRTYARWATTLCVLCLALLLCGKAIQKLYSVVTVVHTVCNVCDVSLRYSASSSCFCHAVLLSVKYPAGYPAGFFTIRIACIQQRCMLCVCVKSR